MPIHNFSGGPGALPKGVEEAASRALLCVDEVGLPLLGISHRSCWFSDVVVEAEQLVRDLLGLPAGYHVLFLQGGATLQFSTVAAILLGGKPTFGEYLNTGYWSGKCLPEARKEGRVKVLWDGIESGYSRLPSEDELSHSPDAAYFHYISNETVEGLQFHRTPGIDGVRRVCDMSSDFLSRPLDGTQFDIIYAHAQKNLGPAGVTIVVVKDDVLADVPEGLPAMMDYRLHASQHSIFNTPPTFAIYVVLLVLRWLRNEIGSLAEMNRLNEAKAAHLYGTLDDSDGFYLGRARACDRSLMNVAFNLPTPSLEAEFLAAAKAHGMVGLEGHRSIGGIRASIYNAVSMDSVQTLCRFMSDFQASRSARIPSLELQAVA